MIVFIILINFVNKFLYLATQTNVNNYKWERIYVCRLLKIL